MPRVGYREGRLNAGWSFFSEGLVTAARPQAELTYAEDRDGRLLARRFTPGLFLMGRRNLTAFANLNVDTQLTGDTLLSTTSGNLFLQVDPSRGVTRVGFRAPDRRAGRPRERAGRHRRRAARPSRPCGRTRG